MSVDVHLMVTGLYQTWNQDTPKTIAALFKFYIERAETFDRQGTQRVWPELRVECQAMIRSLESHRVELLLLMGRRYQNQPTIPGDLTVKIPLLRLAAWVCDTKLRGGAGLSPCLKYGQMTSCMYTPQCILRINQIQILVRHQIVLSCQPCLIHFICFDMHNLKTAERL